MRLKPVFLAVIVAFLFAAESFAGILNQSAPDFSLEDLSGKPVGLSDFRGKVVLVDFWASWCGPCKKELPELNNLLGKYSDSELAIVAVNIDKKRSYAEGFLASVPGLSKRLVVLLDPDSTVIPRYGAAAMPTSFILDREGIVRYVHFGFREKDPQAWVEEIDKLLGKGR